MNEYTEELKNNQSDTISKEFTAQLEKEKESFQKDQYNEWLNGSRDYSGVIREIAKHFTEDRESSLYDNEKDVYSFVYDEEEAKSIYQEYTDQRFSLKGFKSMLLDEIRSSGNNIANKKRAEAEKRKIEREATNIYKAKRLEGEKQAREAKLKALTV